MKELLMDSERVIAMTNLYTDESIKNLKKELEPYLQDEDKNVEENIKEEIGKMRDQIEEKIYKISQKMEESDCSRDL